jgi:DNA invertase Pin-like site-specific DNA recombinase
LVRPPAREKLLEAARRQEVDVVLVWRLDRWGRSVTDLLATLQELEHLGVGFVSLTEALDLTVEITSNTRLFHDAVAPHVKRVVVDTHQFASSGSR